MISGNTFEIQNRVTNGGVYGVYAGYAVTTNLTVQSNTISFDNGGTGLKQFWGVDAALLTGAGVTNNTVEQSNNNVSGSALTLSGNRTPAGGLLWLPEIEQHLVKSSRH